MNPHSPSSSIHKTNQDSFHVEASKWENLWPILALDFLDFLLRKAGVYLAGVNNMSAAVINYTKGNIVRCLPSSGPDTEKNICINVYRESRGKGSFCLRTYCLWASAKSFPLRARKYLRRTPGAIFAIKLVCFCSNFDFYLFRIICFSVFPLESKFLFIWVNYSILYTKWCNKNVSNFKSVIF